jgi:hypothetical protein
MRATRIAPAGTRFLTAAILISLPAATVAANDFIHVTPEGDVTTSETPIPGPLHSTVTLGIKTSDYFRGAFDGVDEDIETVNGRAGMSVSLQMIDQPGAGLSGLSITGGSDNGLTNDNAADDGDWHESDNYIGLAAEFGDAWQAAVTYTYYATPDISATDPLQEVALAFGYGGDDFLGDVGPQIKLAKPVDETEGWFTGVSMRPAFPVGEMSAGPVEVRFPMEAGIGFDDYYGGPGGDTGMYGSVGAEVGVPLGMPSSYGNWEVAAGVSAMFRDDTIRRAGGPQDDGGSTVFTGGLRLSVVY